MIERVYEAISELQPERSELTARDIAQRLRIKNEMSIYSALVVLEKAAHIERGRASDRALLCWAKVSVDRALEAVSDDTMEGAAVRDLIFNRNINQREATELDVEAIGASLGLSDTQVRQALNHLSERGLIECKNAYQGRGIKLLDSQPATRLRIDKQELATRAAAEQWKLRRMIDFCYYRSCLRHFILKYFGDRKNLMQCGMCSNCLAQSDTSAKARLQREKKSEGGTLTLNSSRPTQPIPEATALDHFIIEQAPTGKELREELRKRSRPGQRDAEKQIEATPARLRARQLNPAETTVVIKILSCVARLKNQYGKGTVAAVLRGSASKQILQNGLDQLSTYGLLKHLTQDEITSFIKSLIDARCIAVRQGAYPTVSLTDLGREVMLGHTEIKLELSD